MARGRVSWMLGLCLTLSACEASRPPSAEPPDGEQLPPVSDPDAGTPVPDPTDDGGTTPGDAGTPQGLEGPPSLPARACIPWTNPTPPVRAVACGSTTVLANGNREEARYDADSHPLEVRTYSGETLVSTETHVWEAGLERLSRVEYPNGSFSQTEWIYDAGLKLQRRVRTGSPPATPDAWDYSYDAQGRIAFVARRASGEQVRSVYGYDSAGRLVSIENEPTGALCGGGDTRCARLTYWGNGRLQRHAWQTAMEDHTESYDQAGRLVEELIARSDSGERSLLSYDAQGRRTRVGRTASTATTGSASVTDTVYDAAGQRERFAEDVSHYDSCGPVMNCEPDRVTRTRVTRRTTFICDTQIIALDEWDSDEDGVVDAQRTHERDTSGRLVHEEYTGTPGLDDGPVRRDFRYECP